MRMAPVRCLSVSLAFVLLLLALPGSVGIPAHADVLQPQPVSAPLAFVLQPYPHHPALPICKILSLLR